MNGRKKIFTTAEITQDNVLKELSEALLYHIKNALDINGLIRYRRGIQPILNRTKEVRPEICNKIVVNIANQAVVFHNGYFLTKPAFYVSRKDKKTVANKVKQLNDYLYQSGKNDVDNDLVDIFHTCGVSVLYVTTDKDTVIKCYALDPRQAFVVYSRNPGNPPAFAVNVVVVDKTYYYDVFTEKEVFRIKGGVLVQDDTMVPEDPTTMVLEKVERNAIGKIPIIEYIYDKNRMGVFESAIPIMDAYNLVESNRLDGIEQFIQSLTVLYNCQLEDGVTANTIRQNGLITLKSVGDNKADIKILSEQLDQSQTQTTLDDLYEQILNACAMPSVSRNEGSSSDNGSAVYMKAGYSVVDTVTRNTTDLFKQANRQFDEIFVSILKQKESFDIDINDFELYIEPNSVSNLLVKSQAALNMKELGLSPELVLEKSGLSNDPIEDVARSKKYIEMKWENSNGVQDISKENSIQEDGQQESNDQEGKVQREGMQVEELEEVEKVRND